LHYSDTKALKLWSDFLQIQAKKSLKRWLDISDKKELQLWLDLLQIQTKKSLKQRLYFPRKKDCNYGRICLSLRLKNL